MANDKPDADKSGSEARVKEWFARRLGENLPPRPRPTGPRPSRLPDPPLTAPAPARPTSARPTARRITSTLIPRGETPAAPVAVGPPARRISLNEAGFVIPDGGRPTENEDTGELLADMGLARPTPPETFPADEPDPGEVPTRELSPLRARTAFDERRAEWEGGRAAWQRGTTPDVEPFPPGPVRGTTPPAPDAFTAGYLPTTDAVSGFGEPFPEPPPPDDFGSDDPITRRIPPSEEEDRLTGELDDVFLLNVPSAGPNPTPTLEQIAPMAPAAVIEVSETGQHTAELELDLETDDVPLESAEAGLPAGGDVTHRRGPDGAIPGSASFLVPFERPQPPDAFLFGTTAEPDTVVLPDEEDEKSAKARFSATAMWIIAGSVMGVLGFGLAVAGLLVWLWLLA